MVVADETAFINAQLFLVDWRKTNSGRIVECYGKSCCVKVVRLVIEKFCLFLIFAL